MDTQQKHGFLVFIISILLSVIVLLSIWSIYYVAPFFERVSLTSLWSDVIHVPIIFPFVLPKLLISIIGVTVSMYFLKNINIGTKIRVYLKVLLICSIYTIPIISIPIEFMLSPLTPVGTSSIYNHKKGLEQFEQNRIEDRKKIFTLATKELSGVQKIISMRINKQVILTLESGAEIYPTGHFAKREFIGSGNEDKFFRWAQEELVGQYVEIRVPEEYSSGILVCTNDISGKSLKSISPSNYYPEIPLGVWSLCKDEPVGVYITYKGELLNGVK